MFAFENIRNKGVTATVLLNLNSRHEKRHRRINRGWIFILKIQCQIFDLYAGIYGKKKINKTYHRLQFFKQLLLAKFLRNE